LSKQQNEQPTQTLALCTVSDCDIHLSESKLTFIIIQRLDSNLAPISQHTVHIIIQSNSQCIQTISSVIIEHLVTYQFVVCC